MKDLSYIPSHPDTGGWRLRHQTAVIEAEKHRPYTTHERVIVQAIGAWCDYAKAHAELYEAPIGEDYVLGLCWARWGFALRDLLNGNCGRLDCGTLDTIIHDNLKEQGFDPDMGAPRR